jgi:hypothetical protein
LALHRQRLARRRVGFPFGAQYRLAEQQRARHSALGPHVDHLALLAAKKRNSANQLAGRRSA